MDWLEEYIDDDGPKREIYKENPTEDDGEYLIEFDYEGESYHCYVQATSSDEAVAIFLENHEGLTEDDIFDMDEV